MIAFRDTLGWVRFRRDLDVSFDFDGAHCTHVRRVQIAP